MEILQKGGFYRSNVLTTPCSREIVSFSRSMVLLFAVTEIPSCEVRRVCFAVMVRLFAWYKTSCFSKLHVLKEPVTFPGRDMVFVE